MISIITKLFLFAEKEKKVLKNRTVKFLIIRMFVMSHTLVYSNLQTYVDTLMTRINGK